LMRTENTGVSGSASGIADCMMMVLRPVHRLRPDCIPLRAARLPLLAGSMRSRMLLPQLLAATIGACRMRRAMLGEADITKLRMYVPWPSPVIEWASAPRKGCSVVACEAMARTLLSSV
jgi:hypothetical protein